jgi:hypothetical protein
MIAPRPLALLLLLAAPPAFADAPQIVGASLMPDGDGWTVSVTLAHPDTGWDHYADGWEVLAPDGTTKLGLRELAHPHETEQPFTRSLSGLTIPAGMDHVLIRARCNVDGWATGTLRLPLP